MKIRSAPLVVLEKRLLINPKHNLASLINLRVLIH